MENYLHLHATSDLYPPGAIKEFLVSYGYERVAELSQDTYIFQSDKSPSTDLIDMCDNLSISHLKCQFLSTESSGIIDITGNQINEFIAPEGNKIVINTRGNWAYKNQVLKDVDSLKEKAHQLGLLKKDKSLER